MTLVIKTTKNQDDPKNEDEDYCGINYPERVILYGRGICRFAQFFSNIILLDLKKQNKLHPTVRDFELKT